MIVLLLLMPCVIVEIEIDSDEARLIESGVDDEEEMAEHPDSEAAVLLFLLLLLVVLVVADGRAVMALMNIDSEAADDEAQDGKQRC